MSNSVELTGYLEENGVVVSSPGCHYCDNAMTVPELSSEEDLLDSRKAKDNEE